MKELTFHEEIKNKIDYFFNKEIKSLIKKNIENHKYFDYKNILNVSNDEEINFSYSHDFNIFYLRANSKTIIIEYNSENEYTIKIELGEYSLIIGESCIIINEKTNFSKYFYIYLYSINDENKIELDNIKKHLRNKDFIEILNIIKYQCYFNKEVQNNVDLIFDEIEKNNNAYGLLFNDLNKLTNK